MGRTKVIPYSFAKQACLKLVFSTLWKTSQRWRAATTAELERQPLALLLQELGLPLYLGQDTHVHRWLLTPRLLQEISDLTVDEHDLDGVHTGCLQRSIGPASWALTSIVECMGDADTRALFGRVLLEGPFKALGLLLLAVGHAVAPVLLAVTIVAEGHLAQPHAGRGRRIRAFGELGAQVVHVLLVDGDHDRHLELPHEES